MRIENLTDAVSLVETLTEIPSGSLNPDGVMLVQRKLAEMLQSAGFRIHWHPAQTTTSPTAELLEATKAGSSAEWITLVSHADTLDHGFEVSGKINLDRSGDRLVAPGILDDKASQIVGLWGLIEFLKLHPSHRYGLRFVSSPNEELGSPGFQSFYENVSKSSAIALGLEPAYQGRDIVKERRGNRWYDVEIHGLEAHSGRDPEKGLSALHDLGIKVSKIVKLNRPSKGLSINVGEITSDNPTYNLVAGRATAKIDLRFLDLKSRDRAHRNIDRLLLKPALKALASGQRTRTSYKIVDDCPPLKATRESAVLAEVYAGILRTLENNPKIAAVRSGGAADVSYMARKKLKVLDGLGAAGGNMHRKDEFVVTASIETRARALSRFLQFIENT